MRLTLDRAWYDALVGHARREYPNEACALLAGRPGPDGLTVTKVYALPNAEASPTFYRVEPRAQLAAMNEMEERDWDLVGVFHSHTFTEAYPSRTDVQLAAYPEAAYLIVSLADPDRPDLRAFAIRDGEVTPVPLRVTGGAEATADGAPAAGRPLPGPGGAGR